jgi:hypothetical protein
MILAQQAVGFVAPAGRQSEVSFGDLFLCTVHRRTLPIEFGAVIRTSMIAPGRNLARPSIGASDISACARGEVAVCDLKGQPPPMQVMYSVASAGTPRMFSVVNSVSASLTLKTALGELVTRIVGWAALIDADNVSIPAVAKAR